MTDKVAAPQTGNLLTDFVRYTDFEPLVPVYCVTPHEGRIIHRFFDTSPVSPSGRYLGLTRFPFEDRSPRAGDTADVVVVDLETGAERVIASTTAWGSQLGAQVQWGADDSELFFNQMTNWKPFGICYNPADESNRVLDRPVYNISPDGRFNIAPCLRRTGQTQLGYGVAVPDKEVPVNRGAAQDDGVYITDVESGTSRLLISIAHIVSALPGLSSADYAGGDFYVFHTKWSPDGQRIMVVLRWTPRQQKRWWQKNKPADKKTMRKFVVTVAADGSDPRLAISDALWARGGHHPNWHPDSNHVIMNLNLNGDGLRFVSADIDGSQVRLLHPSAVGSGHPSIHPGGRFLLTDAYPKEPVSYGDGTVPIRLVDLHTGDEKVIVRIGCMPKYIGNRKEMRLDAHPAWDRTGGFVVFNGCPDGTRRVYIADVRGIIFD